MQKLLRLVCEEHGVELVEFAMSGLALVVLLFGVVQWMLAMYAYHFTTYAAQQGARFATVRGHTWSKFVPTPCSTSAPPNFTMTYDCEAQSSDIQNYVQSLATGGINPNNVLVTGVTTGNAANAPIWPGTNPDGATTGCTTNANSQGCMVKVTVSYSFNFIPFLKISALPIGATSESVIMQ